MPESGSSPGLAGFAVAAVESAPPSAVGSAFAANESDGQGAVSALELSGAGASSTFGSAEPEPESTDPGAAARTVSSAATEVTTGDFMGLGKVTAASTGAASADEASASADDDLLTPPLPGPGDGSFGLVVREAAGGVAPEADDFPDAGDLSALFDEEPRASAALSSEDLSLPSAVSPSLLSDSGLGSTLFRTTVSG